MFKQMKKAIHAAELKRQKVAMFHYQVLKNAKELEQVNPIEFCKEMGMSKTYSTEFRKMISLARVVEEQGTKLV